MGKIGEKLDVDFVVSTGDNFYDNGLTGEHDQAFTESFTNIYKAKSLQKQWYSGMFQPPFPQFPRILQKNSSFFFVCLYVC